MKRILLSLILLPIVAQAKLTVGTTTSDLEALVKEVGGNEVTVFAIVKGSQDPHQIEAKPSYMVKFRSADLVLAQGLDLEAAWLKPLIEGARNPKISMGGRGFYELGPELNPIEVPAKDITRAEGDVHPGGNPHFQLDPIRVGRAAELIAIRLSELDSAHAALYKDAAEKLKARLEKKTADWQARMAKTGVKEVVSYHKTMNYFFDRFGIKNALQLEPKPGIPPTAAHLIDVIRQMKERKLKLILIENYFDDSVKNKFVNEVPGVKVVRVPVSVGGVDQLNSVDDVIENLVKTFEGAK